MKSCVKYVLTWEIQMLLTAMWRQITIIYMWCVSFTCCKPYGVNWNTERYLLIVSLSSFMLLILFLTPFKGPLSVVERFLIAQSHNIIIVIQNNAYRPLIDKICVFNLRNSWKCPIITNNIVSINISILMIAKLRCK